MAHRYLIVICSIFASCTTIKPVISPAFEAASTSYHVKGLQGWMTHQRLSFGTYLTSVVRRGWDFSGSLQHTRFGISPEDMILSVFDIHTDRKRIEEKSSFQFVLQDGAKAIEIYGTERFSEGQLVFKSNNPFIDGASKTNRSEYSFTAILVPVSKEKAHPWSLVMIHRYDSRSDSSGSLFATVDGAEEGYVTDGAETIAIRPVCANTKIPMLSGYELQMDGIPLAIVDVLNAEVRISNNLSSDTRLMVSAVASAILVRKMQKES